MKLVSWPEGAESLTNEEIKALAVDMHDLDGEDFLRGAMARIDDEIYFITMTPQQVEKVKTDKILTDAESAEWGDA